MINNKEIKKILIAQFYQIGDVLLATPLIRIVRKHFPDATIDFVADKIPAHVLENNIYLSNIIIKDCKRDEYFKLLKFYLSIRKKKYDMIIDRLGTSGTAQMTLFSGAKYRLGFNLRGRKIAYNILAERSGERYHSLNKLNLLKAIGINDEETKLDFQINQNSINFIKKYFSENNINDSDFIVTVSPYNRRASRRWEKEYFAKVCDWLSIQKNAKIIFQYGPGELDYIQQVRNLMKNPSFLQPPTSFNELGALLKLSNLMITNDNGPRHLATALDTPTVTVYGATNPIPCQPPNSKIHLFLRNNELNCIGCEKRICPLEGENYMACMKSIKPEEVIKIISTL